MSFYTNEMGNEREYDLDDFEDIINNGFVCTLPSETISIISTLAEEVGAPTYVKTPVFEKRDMHKKRRIGNQNVTDSEWESIRDFKTTEINKRTGINKSIDDIRGIINKMALDNFEMKRDELFGLIDSILMEEESEVSMERVGVILFDMVSGNKFYSELYANLYKDLMDKYDIF